MKINLVAVAAIGLATIVNASAALAGAKDYEFQPVAIEVRSGTASELSIRVVHKASGKLVEGAVLFRTRLDMSPDNMGDMTAKHAAIPSSEPGVYRFSADLMMAGGWALKLQAKVSGESETVAGTVIFRAK
ncbi:MAG: FixH family protein [Hyphomicrobiaceae bacterium]